MVQVSKPPRILLVEDDSDVREMLSELLTHEGYATDAAPDVPRALECLALRRPDLVITDLMMPGEAGTGLLRQLANDPDHGAIPTILLTAAGSPAAEQAIAEAGVRTELCFKPVRIEELLGMIRRLVAPATAGAVASPTPAVSASAERGSVPPRAPE